MNNPESSDLIYTDWTVIESKFDPEQIHGRETVFTIGNGYLGTRGSFEEGYPLALPATLIHGLYDDVPVVYTELANCPDWLSLVVIVEGERFRLDRGEILHYERQLDLHHGILSRSVRWRSPKGNTVDLRFSRFASLADPHLLALRCQITPIDFEGTIEVQASINGYPENQGFDHWQRLDQGQSNEEIWLQMRTRSTRIELGMAAKMTVLGTIASLQVMNTPGYPTLSTSFSAIAGQTITVEKIIAVFNSQQTELPVAAAQRKLAEGPTYGVLPGKPFGIGATLRLRAITKPSWRCVTICSNCLSRHRQRAIALAFQPKRSLGLATGGMYFGTRRFLFCPFLPLPNRRSPAIC
jgi:trehalose/maltose hydrolase-like predicted phosphorylase